MYVQNYKSVYIKHQLKAYILTKYEVWKCDNYKVTSRFYAMLDAKMYIVIVSLHQPSPTAHNHKSQNSTTSVTSLTTAVQFAKPTQYIIIMANKLAPPLCDV